MTRSQFGALGALQHEFLAEMAAALGRAQTRIDTALAKLDETARAIDAVDPDDRPGRNELIDRYNAQRRIAERRRWELMVQREAIGIRANAKLYECFPIPPAKRRV